MLAQINDANKAHFRNTISPEEYARRRHTTARANFLDLLNGLEEADFEESLAGGETNTASARTVVPHPRAAPTPLRKPVICTDRVAIDETPCSKTSCLCKCAHETAREVSDMMKAELLDPEGSVFQARAREATQLVRETGKRNGCSV